MCHKALYINVFQDRNNKRQFECDLNSQTFLQQKAKV